MSYVYFIQICLLYLCDLCLFHTDMFAFIYMLYVYSVQLCLLYLHDLCIFQTDMFALSK